MTELGHHVCGTIRTRLSKEAIAALFFQKGWSVRRCSWTDYELDSPTAELVIEADDPVLIHGSVANSAIEAREIATLLSEAGIEFSMEGYDQTGRMVASFP